MLDVLGIGGFAVTYLAKDEDLDRLFAIKEYFPDAFALRTGASVRPRVDKEDDFKWGMQRFMEEARNLARFDHPNIVGVTQIIEANNTAYIVLEYQSGCDLKEWLKRLPVPPTQDQLDAIVEPVLAALERIHANQMLHRDLAPDNIYIRDDGSPVILDLGAAREAVAARSRTVSAIVKSGYSPTEQYSTRGSGQGPWSDIYALAATLYLCVMGRAPEEATERIISDQYEPAAQAADRGYRPSFLAAIDWGLRLKPAERPQTVDEWRNVLLKGEPLPQPAGASAQPAGVTAEAKPEVQPAPLRTPKARLALALVVIALAAGGGMYALTRGFDLPLLGGNKPVAVAKPSAGENSASPAAEALNSFKSLSAAELCEGALDGERWSAGAKQIGYVTEAARRHLTVEACKAETASADPRVPEIRAMPNRQLCERALSPARTDWDQGIAYRLHVQEAARRGLTLAACRDAIAPAAAADSRLAAATNLQNSQLCGLAMNASKTAWESAAHYEVYVQEASRRGLTVEACHDAIMRPVVQAMSAPELCEFALDTGGEAWDSRPGYRDYVEEAARRGLSAQSCRRMAANAPATPPAPVAPAPPAPKQSASVAPNPGPATPSQASLLGIDRVVGSQSDWIIGLNKTLDGCVANVKFPSGTTMWFGYTGSDSNEYLAFSNPKWSSVQVNARYNIVITLGEDIKVPAVFAGVSGLTEKGVFRSNLNQSFIDSLLRARTLGLVLGGQSIAELQLTDFGDVARKTRLCQADYLRGRP